MKTLILAMTFGLATVSTQAVAAPESQAKPVVNEHYVVTLKKGTFADWIALTVNETADDLRYQTQLDLQQTAAATMADIERRGQLAQHIDSQQDTRI